MRYVYLDRSIIYYKSGNMVEIQYDSKHEVAETGYSSSKDIGHRPLELRFIRRRNQIALQIFLPVVPLGQDSPRSRFHSL